MTNMWIITFFGVIYITHYMIYYTFGCVTDVIEILWTKTSATVNDVCHVSITTAVKIILFLHENPCWMIGACSSMAEGKTSDQMLMDLPIQNNC